MHVKATSRRMRDRYTSDRDSAIIDLCDEFFSQHRSLPSVNPTEEDRRQMRKACMRYVEERRTRSGLLSGVLWFLIKPLVARIIAAYIADLFD